MKKDIIIVTVSLGNDGAERVLSELAGEWVSDGNKVTIIQTCKGFYGCSFDFDKSVEIIDLPIKYKFQVERFFKEILALRKELLRRPGSVAISFVPPTSFDLAVCKFFTKTKIILSERNDPRKCPDNILKRWLRNVSFLVADICVFQTNYAMSLFPKRVQKKGIIIKNPINENLPPRFTGKRRKVIVTACRLHPQKNLPLLINAFKMLTDEFPDFCLEIYGQGDEREKLENLIKQLNLQDKVFMPGFVDNIYQKIVDASMYVSSSNYEGISNSIMEALGMGVPTIATDCPIGGSKAIIDNGENGILVPVGDVNAMYLAMKEIISNEKLSEKLSLNACKIKNKYSIHKIGGQWLSIM